MSVYRKIEDVTSQNPTREDTTDMDVDISSEPAIDEQIIEHEDGSVSLVSAHVMGGAKPIPDDLPFDANLALYIPDSELATIGSDLKQKVTEDIASNSEWREIFTRGLKFLGFTQENRDQIFKGASGSWDSKLLEALIRFHAEVFAELFPSDGPSDTRIVGLEDDDTRDRSTRIKMWMNYYLTKEAKEYYDNSETMLNYSILGGSTFRKTYIDPILRRPTAKFMSPLEVAMPYTASSIYDAERFTHITTLTQRDFNILKIQNFYRDVNLSPAFNGVSDVDKADVDIAAGRTDDISFNEQPYEIYETITDYDLPGFEHRDATGEITGIPLPYRITLDANSGEILRIEKNWKQVKLQKTGTYERNLNVSHWKFMPGFGPFGIGLIHCLGGIADTRTKLKRMLQDGGVFSNFPPTIRVKGLRMEHNHEGLRPGENVEIDTGGLPINNAIQQMAVKEPSGMLFQLYTDDGNAADRLIGNMDITIGEGRQDAPVGTTLALLEAAKKPQTGVLRRYHRALGHELEIFYELFGLWLPQEPYPFLVPGNTLVIMQADFDGRVSVLPVSDPNNMSQQQRIMQGDAVRNICQSIPPNAPPYQIEAARRQLSNMNITGIEKLLPPMPQKAMPLDPVTENQNAMTGQPLKAFVGQNHDAHIMVHGPIAEGNPSMQAHIQEHNSLKYRALVEQVIGAPLPPPGTQMPPEVENRIALLAAAATKKYLDEQKAANPPQPTMEQIMMADIQQKREKAQLLHDDAQAKLETEEKIEMLKSDDNAAERAKDLKIALLKTGADLSMDATAHHMAAKTATTASPAQSMPLSNSGDSDTMAAMNRNAYMMQEGLKMLGSSIMESNQMLARALTAPKQIVRDRNGRPIGVETVTEQG